MCQVAKCWHQNILVGHNGKGGKQYDDNIFDVINFNRVKTVWNLIGATNFVMKSKHSFVMEIIADCFIGE